MNKLTFTSQLHRHIPIILFLHSLFFYFFSESNIPFFFLLSCLFCLSLFCNPICWNNYICYIHLCFSSLFIYLFLTFLIIFFQFSSFDNFYEYSNTYFDEWKKQTIQITKLKIMIRRKVLYHWSFTSQLFTQSYCWLGLL